VVSVARGNLADQPISALLGTLGAEERTGILTFTGVADKVVCLADGEVYLAMSATSPPLPRLLEEMGVADQGRWKQALDTTETEAVPIADALVDAGAPTDRLRGALWELSVGTLLEMLVPGTDTFVFEEGRTHQIGARYRFPVDEILAEAGDRLARWSEISDRLPAMDTLLCRSESLPPDRAAVTLDQVQWRIIGHLDSPLATGELLSRIGLSAFVVFEELHRLLEVGLVETLAEDASLTSMDPDDA
jgi:hypothetical protein